MSGRLIEHLGMPLGCLLCCFLVAVGCSNTGPGNANGATFRTSGGGSNGSATGASSGGNSQTNGSSGGLTGGSETGGATSGGHMGCESPCNLPGQYCDDAGQCVACLGDQECKSSLQPHCYTDTGPYFGTCVECLGSSQCQPGEVCSPQLMCVPGCEDTNSCTGQAPICEPDSGVCVSCLSAAECNGGLVCEKGACMECTGNYECYLNYTNSYLWVCSPEDNCVQCIMDDDCPDGEHCVGTGCQ